MNTLWLLIGIGLTSHGAVVTSFEVYKSETACSHDVPRVLERIRLITDSTVLVTCKKVDQL